MKRFFASPNHLLFPTLLLLIGIASINILKSNLHSELETHQLIIARLDSVTTNLDSSITAARYYLEDKNFNSIEVKNNVNYFKDDDPGKKLPNHSPENTSVANDIQQTKISDDFSTFNSSDKTNG